MRALPADGRQAVGENQNTAMKMDEMIFQELCRIAGPDQVKKQELMKKHTTFRIGGPADFFVTPDNPEAVRAVLQFCREEGLPVFVMGNGSNLLVADSGFRGVVIQLDHNFQKLSVCGNRIRAQAGALLSKIAAEAERNALSGLEFASGIPGTIGGGAAMNAGAYGGELKNVLKGLLVLDDRLEFLELPEDQLDMGYRTSRVQKSGWIVLEGEAELQPGDRTAVRARMEKLRAARTAKQPLEFGSAGSTFKRPEGYYAGKLIMDAGLRGYRDGDAQVSEKHCGFVINRGDASAEQVCRLMRHVRSVVQKQSGVLLEPEIRFLGFEENPMTEE